MSNVIPLRRPEVEIRTLREALAWGDSWRDAYRQLYRSAVAEADALQWEIMDLRTQLTIERSERLLEKLGKS